MKKVGRSFEGPKLAVVLKEKIIIGFLLAVKQKKSHDTAVIDNYDPQSKSSTF